MPFARGSRGPAGARTRILAYGLLAFCVLMLLFGPSVAELGLQFLGCPGRMGSAATGCQGLAMLPASALLPWLSAMPFTDTPFLLLEQTWPVLLVWLILVVLSLRSDQRRRATDGSRLAASLAGESPHAGVSVHEPPSFAARQAAWVRQKQAEQVEEQARFQRRAQVEGGLWGALSVLWGALIVGLLVFCLALGTPLIGGMNAEGLLRALGCADPSPMSANPWSGQCGFWTERLAPYTRPWFGALLSPVWLFTQFSDLLLAWLGAILLLTVLPALRVGGSLVLRHTGSAIKVAWLALFAVALLAELFVGMTPPASPTPGGGGLGAVPVGALETLFGIGLLLLVMVPAALIALLVLAIAVWRQFRRGSPQPVARPPVPAKGDAAEE